MKKFPTEQQRSRLASFETLNGTILARVNIIRVHIARTGPLKLDTFLMCAVKTILTQFGLNCSNVDDNSDKL